MSNQIYSNLDQRKRYPLDGLIIEDTQNNITTITGDLQIPNLVYDVSNDDIVSVDGVGILYKTPKINMLEDTDSIIKSVEFAEDPVINPSNINFLNYNETNNKIEMSPLPPNNPFDQDLNTTDDVIFNKVTSGIMDVSILLQLQTQL